LKGGGEHEIIKKILGKKVLRVIPIWLLILMVTVPLAAAASFWLSNEIYTTVTVSDAKIKITGDFDASPVVGSYFSNSFAYAASGSPAGYLVITFTGAAITSTDKVLISVMQVDGQNLGFAKTSFFATGGKTFTYGSQSSTPSSPLPITFGSSGTIKVVILLDMPISTEIIIDMRVGDGSYLFGT
jgi:hypothetical protein